ncbi:PREDICTED: CD151 antigen-like isoform X1 [Acropora digitifera]|uniref:CD151 antigen-like isoform X1 n=1 Tax=Acropora digitifera TaxID=70779 RepID=UPI00077A164C|nr:PREDICTED: CD151 antigen-like isoform X1 [Acropora digitifera]
MHKAKAHSFHEILKKSQISPDWSIQETSELMLLLAHVQGDDIGLTVGGLAVINESFFLALAGIGILAVGVWIMVFKSDYKSILDSDIYVIVPGLMIAAGVVVIIVAVVGCVGAVKENRFFLISFLVMVTLIFALELTIGVLAWVYSSKIKEEIQTTIKDKIDQQYGENSDVTKSIDKLQKENKCCGDTGGRSWNNTAWQRVQRSQGKNNIVPDSCCKTQTPDCGARDHPSNINNEGCLTQVEEFFRFHFTLLAITGIGAACTQLIGIFVTGCILRFVEEY